MSELQLAIDLEKEQARSARYFDRMKRNESNLAYIRAKLGVSHKTNHFTLQRIDDLQELAAKWVRHMDGVAGGRLI